MHTYSAVRSELSVSIGDFRDRVPANVEGERSSGQDRQCLVAKSEDKEDGRVA